MVGSFLKFLQGGGGGGSESAWKSSDLKCLEKPIGLCGPDIRIQRLGVFPRPSLIFLYSVELCCCCFICDGRNAIHFSILVLMAGLVSRRAMLCCYSDCISRIR